MYFFSHHIRLTSFQIIIFAFLLAIITGTFLLFLPVASATGYTASFSDALFTSTSAVCVTGLVVRDTYQGWSLFGKFVIIALIQVGGMGVVTIAILISIFSGRKISLLQRSIMKEAINADRIGGILRLTSFIMKFTIGVELCGALLLAPIFCQQYGLVKGCGYAAFHSISAFCNAGFDLCGRDTAYQSFTSYGSSILLNITIVLLIIVGGLGFQTWEDLARHRRDLRHLHLQTKVIVTTTLILIVLPAIYFFLAEYHGEPMQTRVLHSLFQSVTTRTAGFNTADETSLSQTGQMVTIMLMLIGGAPGSTAGGMKVTTFAVLLASAVSVFYHRSHTNIYQRRVDNDIVRKASSLFIVYVLLFLFFAMIISRVENLPLLPCMFETASAIGTVGLTQGITPGLSTISRALLIFLMFFGRVGGLTLIFATFKSRNSGQQMPKEDIAVG